MEEDGSGEKVKEEEGPHKDEKDEVIRNKGVSVSRRTLK